MIEAARRQRILRRAEAALLRAVSDGESPEKVEHAADEVRAAMLSLFKGQRELIIYEDQHTRSEERHLDNYHRKTAEWRSKSVAEIIAHCENRRPE